MISENQVKNFLDGIGPYSALKYVRAVEADNGNNKAVITIREPEKDDVITKEIKFTPFIFVKEIDFDKFFTYETVLIDPKTIIDGSFIYNEEVYSIVEGQMEGLQANFIKEEATSRFYIFNINIPDKKTRKILFLEKMKYYNISKRKLQIDPNVKRLVEGFKYLYEINTLEYPKSIDNPLFKFRKNGNERKIRGTYSDLLQFFNEGGMDIYDRKGMFLKHDDFLKAFKNSSKREQIKLYYGLYDTIKSIDKTINIKDFKFNNLFKIKIDELKVLNTLKEKFKLEINGYYDSYNSPVSVELSNKSFDEYVTSNAIQNQDLEHKFLKLGSKHQLFVTAENTTKWENYVNVSTLFEGIVDLTNNWELAERAISKFVEYFVTFEQMTHTQIVLEQDSFSKLFGDNLPKFIEYFSTKYTEKLNKLDGGKSLTKTKIPVYIDIIGIDKFLDEVGEDAFNVSINEQTLEEINFSFHKSYKGLKFVDIISHWNKDIFESKSPYFLPMNIVSQVMIQTGIRLFKGIEFKDLKILVADIETRKRADFAHDDRAALFPERGEIFQLGVACTKHNYAEVLYAENPKEEKELIERFYVIIHELNPDMILGYNSEKFDFPFLEKRLEMLGGTLPNSKGEPCVYEYIRTLVSGGVTGYNYKFYNKRPSSLKVGGATESYTQTNIAGMSVLDGIHCVQKLKAIDKRPSAGLKQNVIRENIVKPNRVYIDGNKIGEIGQDKRTYFLDDTNGNYFVNEKLFSVQEKLFSKENISRTEDGDKYYGGSNNLYILTNNGIDDKIENCINVIYYNGGDINLFRNSVYSVIEQYDKLILPSKRFGIEYKNTEKWNDIISFLTNLKSDFQNLKVVYFYKDFDKYEAVTGKQIVERYLLDDLWETLELFRKTGQSSFMLCDWIQIGVQRIYTMGYASMWKILLTNWFYHKKLGIPDYEPYRKINGGLIGMFSAGFHKDVVKNDASSLYPAAKLAYMNAPDWDLDGISDALLKFMLNTRLHYKDLKNRYYNLGDKEKSDLYDILQGPLKIFINSYYGFLGAFDVSPFSSMLTAHGITANSRSFARHMIRYFSTKGFVPIYVHTDGVNFRYPDNVDNYTYIGQGKNWLVKKDEAYTGLKAYVAEYNDLFMEDKMGVDIDGIDISCINIAKSNVVHYKKSRKAKGLNELYIGGDLDIVGGLTKEDTSNYIKIFINKSIHKLMGAKRDRKS